MSPERTRRYGCIHALRRLPHLRRHAPPRRHVPCDHTGPGGRRGPGLAQRHPVGGEAAPSKKLAGRDNTTPGSLAAQTYLIRKLRRPRRRRERGGTDDAAYKQPFTHLGQSGTNILAVMPGSDLANEYVMIGAHYDHLDSRSTARAGCSAGGAPGGEICNGAADNASGVGRDARDRQGDQEGRPARAAR